MTPTTTPTATPSATAPAGRGAVLRQTVGSLLVDAALPYLVYVVLTGQGMSDVAALAWSALPPALNVLVQAVRHRRLNPVGVIVLVTIAAGLATSLLSGDARFAVARDAIQSQSESAAVQALIDVERAIDNLEDPTEAQQAVDETRNQVIEGNFEAALASLSDVEMAIDASAQASAGTAVTDETTASTTE